MHHYIVNTIQYYHNHYNASVILTDYIIENLVNENQKLINCVIDNLGVEKYLLLHLKGKVSSINYEKERKVFNEILNNPSIMYEIKKNIHIEGTILEDLDRINRCKKNSFEYNQLKETIINVDEFKN